MRLAITVEVAVADDDLDPADVIAQFVVVEVEDDRHHDGLVMWATDSFTVTELPSEVDD